MKKSIRFGCRIFLAAGEPFQAIVDRAKLCESLGFDSVLIDDHLLYGTGDAAAPEPFTTMAVVAAKTRRIRVGVAVTDLVRRHPAILAQTAATLSSEFSGRTFLGLGAGDPMNQAPFGMLSDHRYGMLREGLEVMRLLWGSSVTDSQSFSGEFFQLKNAYLQTGVKEADIPPLYLAAFGPRMLDLAGRAADGWIPHCHTPTTYTSDLQVIRESARKAGRTLTELSPAYYTLCSVSSKREQANHDILGPAKYFLALIPEALRKIDPHASHPGRIWEKMSHPREQRETIRKIAAEIPENDAYNTVIHGTSRDCVEQIEAYRKSGYIEFMLTFVDSGGLWASESLSSQAQFFAKNVMSKY